MTDKEHGDAVWALFQSWVEKNDPDGNLTQVEQAKHYLDVCRRALGLAPIYVDG